MLRVFGDFFTSTARLAEVTPTDAIGYRTRRADDGPRRDAASLQIARLRCRPVRPYLTAARRCRSLGSSSSVARAQPHGLGAAEIEHQESARCGARGWRSGAGAQLGGPCRPPGRRLPRRRGRESARVITAEVRPEHRARLIHLHVPGDGRSFIVGARPRPTRRGRSACRAGSRLSPGRRSAGSRTGRCRARSRPAPSQRRHGPGMPSQGLRQDR